MKTNYEKQPIPVGEQINLLESKGMEFFDIPYAFHTLSIIGYYRFSGYAYPFRNKIDNSSFVEETSFEKVFSIYEFDRSLKSGTSRISGAYVKMWNGEVLKSFRHIV